jgi:hypothetical protein
VHIGYPAGQRFRGLFQKARGGRTQYQKLPIAVVFINHRSQQRKQLGNTLNFIQADESMGIQAQKRFGILQLVPI